MGGQGGVKAVEGLPQQSAVQGNAGWVEDKEGGYPISLNSPHHDGGEEPCFWDTGGRRCKAARDQTILQSSRKSWRYHHAQGEVFSPKTSSKRNERGTHQ